MTKHIGLREAMKLVDSIDDPNVAMHDVVLQQFANDVDITATDILKDLDDDYLSGMVSFLRASAIATALEDGDVVLGMVVASEDFRKLVAIIMKHSIGLAAIEELR
jgi:hypothetical protein